MAHRYNAHTGQALEKYPAREALLCTIPVSGLLMGRGEHGVQGRA